MYSRVISMIFSIIVIYSWHTVHCQRSENIFLQILHREFWKRLKSSIVYCLLIILKRICESWSGCLTLLQNKYFAIDRYNFVESSFPSITVLSLSSFFPSSPSLSLSLNYLFLFSPLLFFLFYYLIAESSSLYLTQY